MNKYTLKYPFTTAAGARLEHIEIRRLTRGDVRKASQFSKDEFDQENFMLASMTGLVVEDLDQFDIADAKFLVESFRDMVDGKGESAGL
ncbi:phage tail assembly protein [Pseudomonas kunmingensis]|uniref:phage tail assembly protein n=1 Tax=Stutzerimonas kunmingensis TaxID=1211807 RepID=UPI0017469E0B|nr:phage tail assembly protein [Stutzerimonas kunmingensis]MBD3877363.1 phage tail assembly protein [Stutzerimonas kunmingensis]